MVDQSFGKERTSFIKTCSDKFKEVKIYDLVDNGVGACMAAKCLSKIMHVSMFFVFIFETRIMLYMCFKLVYSFHALLVLLKYNRSYQGRKSYDVGDEMSAVCEV
jgi:hypothetical protein